MVESEDEPDDPARDRAFADLEGELLAAGDMAEAIHAQLETAAVYGIDARSAAAILRCAIHLIEHNDAAARLWRVAAGAEAA